MRFSCYVVTLGLLCLLNGCSEDAFNPTSEEAAVRNSWEEVNEAFESADWDRYAESWVQTADLQLVHPAQGDWISGWSEFESRYRDLVASGDQWDFETRRLEVNVDPSGDTAWGVGEIILTSRGQSQAAWQMVVFRKVNERWKIATAFSSPIESDTH